MVTSVTSSVPPSPACKSSLKSYKSPPDGEDSADRSSFTHSNPLVSVALRPTAILFHLLRNSGLNNSSPTFPLSPAKKGFVEKMFGRRKSVTLNACDPTYKTVYLGNVVTALPKGEGCLKKPLEAIWKHYKTTKQPPAEMVLTVTNAGLKARTTEQGVIQYKANRLTHCAAPLEYPRLFAWIYKHDAKNMKYESRCHAVLCHDEFKARELSAALEQRLQFVFAEWLRTKKSRSQILDRLKNPELAAALPAIPARKQMLSAGQKYKPAEAKARSLSAIREASDEDPSSEDDSGDGRQNLSGLAAGRLGSGDYRGYDFTETSTPPAIFDDIEEELEMEEDEEELEVPVGRDATYRLQNDFSLRGDEMVEEEEEDQEIIDELPTTSHLADEFALTNLASTSTPHKSYQVTNNGNGFHGLGAAGSGAAVFFHHQNGGSKPGATSNGKTLQQPHNSTSIR